MQPARSVYNKNQIKNLVDLIARQRPRISIDDQLLFSIMQSKSIGGYVGFKKGMSEERYY